MKYLLDTNVLSDVRRRAVPSLDAWVEVQPAVELALSSITILEIEVGVQLMERRDATQGAALRRWLTDQVLPRFAGRILPVDVRVATAAAGFHVPDPMADMDALIAGTAQVHGLTLITRNVSDFARTGVPLLNSWTDFG